MSKVAKDISGQIFGRLRLLKKMPNNKWNQPVYLCKCECGTIKSVDYNNLMKGNTTSCGCFHKERAREGKFVHGLVKTKEYKSWAGMNERCSNSTHKRYHLWGGRGIKVCDRWANSFQNFLSDMGPKPSPRHSLDRYPNKDGNYELGNCRWATPKQQSNNTRSNVIIAYNGESRTMAEWADVFQISLKLLFNHYRVSKKKFSDIYEYFMVKRTPGVALIGTPNSKKVGQFHEDRLIKTYFPISSAKKDGFLKDSIRKAAINHIKYKGYTWKYIDEKAA